MAATYHSKVCKDCGRHFETVKKKKVYCPECAARRYKESCKIYADSVKLNLHKKPKAAKPKKKIKPALSIMGVCRLLKKYNEDNSTLYSYGEFVRMIDTGEIEVIVTEGAVDYVKKD